MRKTVGVCVIAKNEEALIGRMLNSVLEADQIVVCDTGSSDKTMEVVESFKNKCKIELHKDFIWTDSFCDAQNHAKLKMTTDVILSIDCDEYLNCSFDEVRRAAELMQDMARVRMVAEGGSRLEFGFGRLFRNSPDIYWVQDAHKHLNLPGEGEEVGNISIIFGWSPAHAKDPDRTLRILEKAVARDGEHAGRNLYYLGREYWYKNGRKDMPDALKKCTATLGRYVQISNWPAEKAEAFLVMSMAYSAMGQDEDARDACLQSLKINSNFKEAIQWMADISTPENSLQWKRMAKTANNRDVMWDRVPASPISDIIFLSTHNDDESLFGAYTLMRVKPLVVIVTCSYIQPLRGDVECNPYNRNRETVEAMKIAGCPVVFLNIPDNELTEEILRERLQGFNPETVYIPAYHEGGNSQHNLVNKVALELFGRDKCEQYCSYVKGDFNIVKGSWEVVPKHNEAEIKNKMLDCYKSQLNLPSTRPHFDSVRGKSEWLL